MVTKSLPICIFLELQPGSESLVGINVATWNMTEEKNLNQGQELSRFLQHEAIRSNGNPPGQNTGLWQITSVPSISSFSAKIPVHGISRVSATHVSFFSLDAKMFSLFRDYCAMVTS